jgi:PEP-CTERM motif
MTRTSKAVFTLAVTAFAAMMASAPARADSITIDSTNCTSTGGCYGLDWTLEVNTGSFSYMGDTYNAQAFLTVTDDPLVSGTPSTVISAVDFKASSGVSSAALYSVPTSTLLGTWTTETGGLSSGGCNGTGSGKVCSDSATDPANFIASATPETWAWYFNATSPIFTDLIGASIGAKLVDLSTPGKLLSADYTVPEPSTLALFAIGLLVVGLYGRRRGRTQIAVS